MLLYLLLLTTVAGPLAAQQNRSYRLTVFGTRNGLLSPKIYALFQSSRQLLWIGTEIGASVYNGYGFQNLQYTVAQEQMGKILAIAEDSLGGIWLGGEGGLFYYTNGEVYRCAFVPNYAPAVESLVVDREGTLWIGEMHGLYRLSTAEIESWRTKKAALRLLPFSGIRQRIICLDADAQNNLCFGSFEGVFLLRHKSTAPKLIWQNSKPNDPVHFVALLSPDSVFFTRYEGESISLLNGAEKNYPQKDRVGQRFFKRKGEVFQLTTSTVERFAEGRFVPLIHLGRETNFAFDALCDAEGNFWLGTWEGLLKYRYNPFSVFLRQETEHPETFSMLETKNGQLLFGGNRGALHTWQNSEIVPAKNIRRPFSLSEVLAIYQHSDGSLWFGSGYQGIVRLRKGSYTVYDETHGLPDNHCNFFYKVDEHTVFGCTEKGVLIFDPLAEDPIKGTYNFAQAYNRQPKLLGVFALPQNRFLFYSNQGLFRLKSDTLYAEKIDGLASPNLFITGMKADKNQGVWIGTQGKGLLHCKVENGRLKLVRQYTKKDGLLADEILSLLVDKNGDLWMSGYAGIGLLKQNEASRRFVNFTDADGLPEAYYQHLYLVQQANGRIWGLSSMNLFSFHPDSTFLNAQPPALFFDSAVSVKKDRLLQTATTPQLGYDENNLAFAFTAVSLSHPAKTTYVYRLLPADTAWTETGEQRLLLNALNPGSYTLQIKAANNAGIWSAPLTFSFQIRPPFWNAWWFYCLLALLVFAGIFVLFRRRLKAVKNKAALRQQITELESKALRAQMNPHFIFNSLNAIQELIVTENVEAAYGYLSKFSKLLRLVLNQSEKAVIPLSDELATLHLYLELESLRFRNLFTYAVDVDERLDEEAVRVPPLLLQPFIENAVWHGLMLKEGEKTLRLTVWPEGAALVFSVEDNGIGRKKAAEIKAQKIGARHFESKGLKLSEQRIGLLEKDGQKGTVKIEDLYENQLAAGTRVFIRLPLMQA